MANIAILGCGFGTALAVLFDKYGHKITLWSPFEEEVEQISRERENKKLLPGVKISDTISLTNDLNCVREAEVVILAVPSMHIRQTVRKLNGLVNEKAIIVNVAKGLEEDTLFRLSQVIKSELPENSIVSLSGPSHAEEVARDMPTTVVASSENMDAAVKVQDLLTNRTLRIYVNSDLVGVELGGMLKNVIALCAGVCDGLGYGDNTKAALITRGITEIARLGVAMGAKTETFAGLTGIGDLVVTCTSMHSRNRRAGILIGKGIDPEEAVRQIGTVEGYYATKVGWKLKQRYNVEMPILEQCYLVLFEGKRPVEAVNDLMSRSLKHETESTWLG